ncbi:MAG: PD40 domain-containing protein [Chitinophagaceae bacterium]|nr:PD40 domain-containing protein [Chitinophagaceae bacterium]
MHRIIFILLLLASPCAYAQLPETVVYLFDMQRSSKGIKIMNPRIISKKSGYNNQPYFTPDGEAIYFVSSMDTTNTEIYRYQIGKKKSRRITKTPEPEYSPKYTPDMGRISCVRVEKDKTTQHLYTYNFKGKDAQLLMPNLKTIGYYEWISPTDFLSFELPEPFYLVKHSPAKRRTDTLATNVGRTFVNLRTKNTYVFVDKTDSMHWKMRTITAENVRSINLHRKTEFAELCETIPGEEDYCFLRDGSVLMGHEGILYIKKNPFRNKDATWDELIDMKTFGISKFYRIAVSPDNQLLAVVAYTGKKP